MSAVQTAVDTQWGSEQTERNLLATVLSNQSTLEPVLERLAVSDFSNPGWGGCYAAIQTLADVGLSVDVHSVIEQMRQMGTLNAAGGEQAILQLLTVVTTGAIRGPIKIVQDYAVRRRIRAMGSSLGSMAADPALGVDELVGQVQLRTAELELPDQAGEARTLSSIMATDDPPEDWVIPDLIERQDRAIVVAPEGKGKALALDTPVPMADGGWRDMGELQVGDEVLAPGFVPTQIVAATETLLDRCCALVLLSDGTEIVADLDHNWMVHHGRRGNTRQCDTWWLVQEIAQSTGMHVYLPDSQDPDVLGVRVLGATMVPSQPVRCVQVAHPSGMFLVGKTKVPTHNSTLLRQVAVMAAAGIHPFQAHRRIEPVRSLIVDLENRERSVRRKIGDLRDQASWTVEDTTWEEERCHLWLSPGGIDLSNRADLSRLAATVKQVQPDLITIGPLYKMMAGDPRDEEVALRLATILEHIAVRYNTALLIEAHAPHGSNGAKREMRPYGASLWQRWPEFGLGMYPQDDGSVAIEHWRGQREDRDWPERLLRGDHWPWVRGSSGAPASEPNPDDIRDF